MLGQIFASMIAPVSDVAKTYLKNKNRLDKAVVDSKIQLIKMKFQAKDNELSRAHDLDSRAAEERKESKKDEWITGAILAPIYFGLLMILLSVFFDGFKGKEMLMVEFMSRILTFEIGDQHINTYPIFFALLFIAVFGFRGLIRKFFDVLKAKWEARKLINGTGSS